MHTIKIETTFTKMLADVYTPVGIYLRLRDRFRDTILLESTDFHAGENSYSFIGINAIGGIEISDTSTMEYKLPNQSINRIPLDQARPVPDLLWEFMKRFEVNTDLPNAVKAAQGLFGYTSTMLCNFLKPFI
jgi:anthranilate synthase component 1